MWLDRPREGDRPWVWVALLARAVLRPPTVRRLRVVSAWVQHTRPRGFVRCIKQVDSEQGYPAEADNDSEALEQPGQIYQTCGLPEARAGEDERDQENKTADGRVDRPSALALRGEPA